MGEYLIETYVPRSEAAAVERGAELARAAADGLAREGTEVSYLRSIFVPEDETCFYVYEAESVDAVRAAAERASLPATRVVKAKTVTNPSGGSAVDRRVGG